MGRIKALIILVLVIVAFGAGIYFKDDAIKFYNSLNKQIQDFQKTDLGQTITQAAKQIFSPDPLNIGGAENEAFLAQSKIIAETNLQRQENGNLPALKENTKLNEAALAKANDMFKNQYFEHISQSGVGPGELMGIHGYEYILVGENLILGNFSSEKEVVKNWMDSPGHRANILNNRYTEIGVAIIKGIYKGQAVWIGVQEFGLPLSSCPQPDYSLKNETDLLRAQLETLYSTIDERKEQIESANHKAAAYKQMVYDYNQMIEQYKSIEDQLKEIINTYNNQVNTFNACATGE